LKKFQQKVKDERNWGLQKQMAKSVRHSESRRHMTEMQHNRINLSKVSVDKERKEQESRLEKRRLLELNRSKTQMVETRSNHSRAESSKKFRLDLDELKAKTG